MPPLIQLRNARAREKGTRGKGEKLTKDTQAYYIPRIMPSIKSPNQGRNLPEWCFFQANVAVSKLIFQPLGDQISEV
jgi:hypothetical protein